MKQSESITDLATALCLAQAQMGGAIKDSNNPFFKSSYADLASVIRVLKEPLANNGLSFVQFPITSEGGQGIGVCTMLMHSSGQWLQGEYLLPMDKVNPQGALAAITYARRGALQSLFGIPAVDDDGNSLVNHNRPAPVSRLDGVPDEPFKRVSKKLTQDIVAIVLESMESGETSVMVEALGELEEHEKQHIWRQFTGKQQEFISKTKSM